jgi:phenylalanine-4-hydroxylase
MLVGAGSLPAAKYFDYLAVDQFPIALLGRYLAALANFALATWAMFR